MPIICRFIAITFSCFFFQYLLSVLGIMEPFQSCNKLLLEWILKTTKDCSPFKASLPSDAVTVIITIIMRS